MRAAQKATSRAPTSHNGSHILRILRRGRHIAGIVGLLVAWDLVVRFGVFKASLLPPPLVVAKTLWFSIGSGQLVTNVEASLIRVVGGFVIAAISGITIAVGMGLWRPAAEVLTPVIDVLRPISPIAWIPLAILWFGLGDGPAWFVIFVACFFPVVTNTIKGVTGIQRNHLRAAACCGMRGVPLVLKIILPSAIPDIVTGLRTGLGIGWMAVIAAEFVSAQSGLGYQIQVAQQLFEAPLVLAGMVTIGVLGFAMNWLMLRTEQRVAPWADTSRTL